MLLPTNKPQVSTRVARRWLEIFCFPPTLLRWPAAPCPHTPTVQKTGARVDAHVARTPGGVDDASHIASVAGGGALRSWFSTFFNSLLSRSHSCLGGSGAFPRQTKNRPGCDLTCEKPHWAKRYRQLLRSPKETLLSRAPYSHPDHRLRRCPSRSRSWSWSHTSRSWRGRPGRRLVRR